MSSVRTIATVGDQKTHPEVNTIWIGPLASSNPNEGAAHPLAGPIELSQSQIPNQINLWVLEQYAAPFQQALANYKIQVKIIETFLAEISKDPQLQIYAERMRVIIDACIHREKGKTKRDRLNIKDAFSILLLAIRGGFTCDTNVYPNNLQQVVFANPTKFGLPVIKNYGPQQQDVYEVWLMYSQPMNSELFAAFSAYYENWMNIEADFADDRGSTDHNNALNANVTTSILSHIDPNTVTTWPVEINSHREFVIKHFGIFKDYFNTHTIEKAGNDAVYVRNMNLNVFIKYVAQYFTFSPSFLSMTQKQSPIELIFEFYFQPTDIPLLYQPAPVRSEVENAIFTDNAPKVKRLLTYGAKAGAVELHQAMHSASLGCVDVLVDHLPPEEFDKRVKTPTGEIQSPREKARIMLMANTSPLTPHHYLKLLTAMNKRSMTPIHNRARGLTSSSSVACPTSVPASTRHLTVIEDSTPVSSGAQFFKPLPNPNFMLTQNASIAKTNQVSLLLQSKTASKK